MRNHVRTALVVLGCAVLTAGLARAQTLPTVRVATCVCEDVKTILYGIRAGIFAKYGVTVDEVPVQNGAAALASLVGGSSDAALSSDLPIFQAHDHGIPLTIVVPAQWYLSDAATAGTLLVRTDSPIKSGRDLNGKTIAVQSIKDLNWAGTMAWVDATGGDSKTVKAVELPLPAVVPALEEGRVDAGSVQTPFLERGIATGKVRLLAKTYDAIGKRFEAAVYVSTLDEVASNHDALSRFAHGMHDSAVYTNNTSHRAEMVDIVAQFTKMDRDLVARALPNTDPEYLDPKTLQPVIDAAFRYNLIAHDFRAEDLFSSVVLRGPNSP